MDVDVEEAGAVWRGGGMEGGVETLAIFKPDGSVLFVSSPNMACELSPFSFTANVLTWKIVYHDHIYDDILELVVFRLSADTDEVAQAKTKPLRWCEQENGLHEDASLRVSRICL